MGRAVDGQGLTPQQRWRLKPGNREREDAKNREWARRNPDKVRVYQRRHDLRRHFGITEAEYDAILAKQGGACAICKGPQQRAGAKHFAVDHDHATGRVRGLLCSRCNVGVGQFLDSPQRLAAALAYLQASWDDPAVDRA